MIVRILRDDGSDICACLRLGRRFIGFELDERWASAARERLAAEESGSTLAAARAGQVPLFDLGAKTKVPA